MNQSTRDTIEALNNYIEENKRTGIDIPVLLNALNLLIFQDEQLKKITELYTQSIRTIGLLSNKKEEK